MLDSLLTYLNQNPEYIFVAAFTVALCESLAVIGIIVPGVGMITAIAILAGNLQLSIEVLVLSAIAGAFIGDALSYYLGRFFQPHLPHVWPFKQHPHWIESGTSFFQRHGGKSIFFGRFIGPIRPFIPLVAGMLSMKQKPFLVLNFASAVLWGMVYLMPAYYLGENINLNHLFSWQGILALTSISLVAIFISYRLKHTSSKQHK